MACSYFLSEVAAQAVQAKMAQIQALLAQENQDGVHIVVGEPNHEVYQEWAHDPDSWDNIAYEVTVLRDGASAWESDEECTAIARGKAGISSRCRMHTSEVLDGNLHMLEFGEPVFKGGVYVRGTAFAVSGFDNDTLDEVLALELAEAILDEANLAGQIWLARREDDVYTLPEEPEEDQE